MRQTLKYLLALAFASLTTAVFQDEVGHIDFHHQLIGLPQQQTTFFHRPRKDDKASLLYTLSDVGVVGAVNPGNGEVVWRQQVVEEELTNGGGFLRAPEGENWVAAAYGSKVQAWAALSGRNVWQMEFEGQVKDLEILELPDAARKDVLVLFEENGTTVLRRLHGGLGTVIWEFRESTKDVPLQVSTDITKILLISLHGTISSYGIKVTTIDIVTGARTDGWTLGTKGDVHVPEDVMFVGGNSAAPLIAWTNASLKKLTVNVLGSKSTQEIKLHEETIGVDLQAPHLAQSQPHFLVHMRTNSGNKAEVYHISLKTLQASKAYDLPLLPGPGAFATSSEGANVYFTRLTEDEVLIFSSDSHAVLARWPYKAGNGEVDPVFAVAEVVKKAGGEGYAVRTAVSTIGENWVLVRNGDISWSRPEGLTGAVAATYAEIPASEDLAKVLEQEAHANPAQAYVHRLTRHIDELKGLPAYVAGLPKSISDSIFGDETVIQEKALKRDAFGFNKIAVVATRRGRFYGLSTGNKGAVLWSHRPFPQNPGQSLDIKGILAPETDSTVVAVGSRGEFVILDTLTGMPSQYQPPQNKHIASTAVVDGAEGKWLLPFGGDGKLISPIPPHIAPVSTIVVKDGQNVKGVRLVDQGGKVVEMDIWQFQLLPGQKIVDIDALPAHNPVASIGRVLGDRRVSYKYLNANNLVIAVHEEATSALSLRLLDSSSGQLLSSQVYNGVDPSKGISCTMAENWYACSFFGEYTVNDGTNRSIKGYQIAVSDLYESPEPNQRGPLGDAESFSPLDPVDTPTSPPMPWVISQSYVISQPAQILSVTTTRQGIANRQILAYLPEAHGIVGLARQLIDPRRPVGRDPTAADMEAEGIPRYAPALEIDPRSIITHEYDVIGVKNVVTTPATVESTSLMLAFGIDIYGTRVAPSGTFDILGKGFNKSTLILTVAALFGGVVFLGPMVRRKQINRRWEAPL